MPACQVLSFPRVVKSCLFHFSLQRRKKKNLCTDVMFQDVLFRVSRTNSIDGNVYHMSLFESKSRWIKVQFIHMGDVQNKA